jgi:hypothetical protein
MKLRTHALRLAVLAALAAPAAHADTISYYLDQSNQTGVLPDGTDYLKVTVTSTGTAIDFTVDILPALLNYADASNFGLDSFGFNVNDSSSANSITASNFSGLPSNWTVQTNANQNGFGKFDLIPQTNGAGNRVSPELTFALTPASGGASSIDQNLADYLVLSSGNAVDGSQFFAAHVAGFTISNSSITSAYFGGSTPVPLPAAGALLLSALTGLPLLSARRRRAQAGDPHHA